MLTLFMILGPALQFVKRGTISVQSLKSGKAHFSPVSSLARDEIQQLRVSFSVYHFSHVKKIK